MRAMNKHFGQPLDTRSFLQHDGEVDGDLVALPHTGLGAHRLLHREQRLWNPAAEAFLRDPDDPNAVVLECTVFDGEWWDAPSTKVGLAVSLVRRAVTGAEPGESGVVDPEAGSAVVLGSVSRAGRRARGRCRRGRGS
jgi:Pyridoxamine 5'-phosphate oxidase like